jgi:uncharacterized protein (UPF0218 family)
VTDAELKLHLDHNIKCIVVGDESAITLFKHNYDIKLAIVDFQTRRRKDKKLQLEVSKIGEKVLKVHNPAGTITDELWSAIEQGLSESEPVRIEVTGEEDLAFIPCMLMAPEDMVIVYGYPGKGLVLAYVNTKNRQLAQEALDSMIKEE